MRKPFHLATLLLIGAVAGCSDSPAEETESGVGGQGAATGGDNGMGAANTGAAASVGGMPSGGANPIGGSLPTGGTSVLGGAPPTGGTAATGGTAGSGGGANTGGGGANATGGTTTGGTGDGGTPATGGTGDGGAPTGGTGDGGTPPTGGTPATGGTGDGGMPATGGGGTTTVTKFIGNIAPKNQDIPADFADHWMQMSMEANSKWGFVQPDSPDQWVWEPVDQAYNYAKDHGLIFKQHNFFWNFEQPGWVNNSNVMEAGETWVRTFCERYPDVPMIDVVNEPLYHRAPYADGMGGDGQSGYDWVVLAYQWAKEYCPNSILIVNDYNIIEWEDDHNNFLALMDAVLAAGAPIDAIGAQGHDVYRAGVDTARGYIDVLTTRYNLPIYITEFDIDLANDQEQLAAMQEAIPMFWDHPNVYGITYWGFAQGSTWRANAWLVSSSGVDRPAMTWLQEFIAAHR